MNHISWSGRGITTFESLLEAFEEGYGGGGGKHEKLWNAAIRRVAIIICAGAYSNYDWGRAAPGAEQSGGDGGDCARTKSAIPAENIPKAITDAVNSPDRPASDHANGRESQARSGDGILRYQARDACRGLMGGRWLYDRIARADCRAAGQSIFAESAACARNFRKMTDAWQARLKQPALANVTAISRTFQRAQCIEGSAARIHSTRHLSILIIMT